MKKLQYQLLFRNRRAFTLIEVLLVLIIVSFVLLITTYRPSQNIVQQIESQIFYDNLLSELKLCQQQAILQKRFMVVHFFVSNQSIVFEDRQYGQLSRTIDLPDHIAIVNGHNFEYSPEGGVSQFNTVIFQDLMTNEVTRLVFQLGNGQFELQ